MYQISRMVLAAMVSGCWTKREHASAIKSFIFLELAAANMLAITNLAIAINLALIVKVNCLVRSVRWTASTLLFFNPPEG